MSEPEEKPRPPRAFRIDDPALKQAEDVPEPQAGAPTRRTQVSPTPRGLGVSDIERGFRWGSLMLSAMVALASLAAGLWFTRFVTIALQRQDWVGWLATALMVLIAASGIILVLKELWGFRRLAHLSRLRKLVRDLRPAEDPKREREAVRLLVRHYAGRSDLKWGCSACLSTRAMCWRRAN